MECSSLFLLFLLILGSSTDVKLQFCLSMTVSCAEDVLKLKCNCSVMGQRLQVLTSWWWGAFVGLHTYRMLNFVIIFTLLILSLRLSWLRESRGTKVFHYHSVTLVDPWVWATDMSALLSYYFLPLRDLSNGRKCLINDVSDISARCPVQCRQIIRL